LAIASSSLCFLLAHAGCGTDDAGAPPGTASGDASASDGTANLDATTAGDGNVHVPGTSGPIDPDAAARAALVLASCITERGADSVLEQIYARVRSRTVDDYGAWVTCIDQKRNGCQAIRDCMGVQADLTGPCSDSCMGNVSVGCDDQLKVGVDCAFYGDICHAGTTSGGGSTATCAPADGVACDTSSFTRRCSAGDRVISCSNRFERMGPSCSAYGLTCNGNQCAGTEGACQAVSGSATQIIFEAQSCEGTRLVACAGGGLTKLDCGLLVTGATCQAGDAAGGGVAAPAFCGLATQCVPGVAPAIACEGDSVTMCNGGRIDKIDCKTMGFSTCVAVGSYAFCGPSLKTEALAAQDGG
jgi:hypothetical protein